MSKENFRKILLFWGDVFLLYVSLLLTVFFGFWGENIGPIFLSHLLPFSVLYLCWLLIFYIFGLYDLNLIKTKLLFYPRLLGTLAVGLALGAMFFYLIPLFGITPKSNLVLNVFIFGISVLFWRNLFYSRFSSYFLDRVAILGISSQTKELAKEILDRPYLGYKLIALIKTGKEKSSPSSGIKILDIKRNLLSQIQEERIETIVLPQSLKTNPLILKNLYQCLPARINFLDLEKFYERISQKVPLSFINQVWFLENLKEGERGVYDKIKRIGDLILASLIILITSPFWLFFALFIKLEDKGPVFYRQKRVGKDSKIFSLIKFRSMKVEAEKGKAIWAKKEDSRITKIGGFLRKTHLDELPQMLNVLKGNLSLIGPRPERPEFVKKLEKEIPHYHLRDLIKPGFTGWAQIKFRYGRSVMDSFEKFQYDLYYIKNRSLILDLGILLKTFQLFFKKE